LTCQTPNHAKNQDAANPSADLLKIEAPRTPKLDVPLTQRLNTPSLIDVSQLRQPYEEECQLHNARKLPLIYNEPSIF
jgi:hypothetical protein